MNCKIPQEVGEFLELQSLTSTVATTDLENVLRNAISFDVEVSFFRQESNSNAFIIFGDDPLHKSRISVGVYGSKKELWIEEHSDDVYGLRPVRQKVETDFDEFEVGGALNIKVNLNLKTISLTFAGQTISSRYDNHLAGLRWVGYRVYNTRAKFGALKINSLENEGSR